MRYVLQTSALVMVWTVVGIAGCSKDEPEPDGAGAAGTTSGAGTGAAGMAGSGAGTGSGAGSGAAGMIGNCRSTGATREELAGMLEPLGMITSIPALTGTSAGVYFVTQGVRRVAADGTLETVVMGEAGGPLASNSSTLAWFGTSNDEHGVLTVPLGSTGGTPTLVAPAPGSSEVLVLDEANAYFGGTASYPLSRAPLPSGEPVELANPFGVQDLRVDGDFVYFAENLGDHLLRVPIAGGGTPEQVTDVGGLVHTFVMDATHFYIADNYSIARVQRSDRARELLVRFKQASSSITNSIKELVVDGDRLVFADRLDNIGWTMKDGSDCAYFATSSLSESPATYPTEIALDQQYLYVFTERMLHRVARSAVGLD